VKKSAQQPGTPTLMATLQQYKNTSSCAGALLLSKPMKKYIFYEMNRQDFESPLKFTCIFFKSKMLLNTHVQQVLGGQI